MPLRHLAYSLYACNSNMFNMLATRHCSSSAPASSSPNTKSDSSMKNSDSSPIALPPAKRLAILTCMDARINPFQQLGLNLGDAHIIRNAGGMARDALRSLIISQRLLGTREIAVYHHTGCGMATFNTSYLRQLVTDSDPLNENLGRMMDNIDFMDWPEVSSASSEGIPTTKIEPAKTLMTEHQVEMDVPDGTNLSDPLIARLFHSVRSDVQFLKTNPLLVKGTKVTGWVHWIETGKSSCTSGPRNQCHSILVSYFSP
ncbi:hypothetical protein GYMLUDRAFT_69807 [Collybiopsis luxurians FD-317 M1]|nr:hypothetical protein GYMLUDRAFT_69807 [Collybiopsis luxurians FD-317 M1]